MKNQHHLSPSTAQTISLILLVFTLLLVFFAVNCVSTRMYELYSSPYKGCNTRYQYFEQQASRLMEDAQREREHGSEAMAMGYENRAYNWSIMAEDARSYVTQHNNGAIALGVGAFLLLLCAGHLFFSSAARLKKANAAAAAANAPDSGAAPTPTPEAPADAPTESKQE